MSDSSDVDRNEEEMKRLESEARRRHLVHRKEKTMEESINTPQTNVPPVECPACGEDMVFTGKSEPSDTPGTLARVAYCPRCDTEGLVIRPEQSNE